MSARGRPEALRRGHIDFLEHARRRRGSAERTVSGGQLHAALVRAGTLHGPPNARAFERTLLGETRPLEEAWSTWDRWPVGHPGPTSSGSRPGRSPTEVVEEASAELPSSHARRDAYGTSAVQAMRAPAIDWSVILQRTACGGGVLRQVLKLPRAVESFRRPVLSNESACQTDTGIFEYTLGESAASTPRPRSTSAICGADVEAPAERKHSRLTCGD